LKARPGISALLTAAGAALLAVTYACTDAGLSHDTVYSPTLVALGAALALLGALNLPLFESKFWVSLTWPGKFSYGIYLFHGLIYYLVFYPLLQKQSTVVAFLLLSVLCTGVMALSYYFFELPVNRWVRGVFGLRTKNT
jgi:peptidoglycan/LPS O-acetylase OafA/YrhL